VCNSRIFSRDFNRNGKEVINMINMLKSAFMATAVPALLSGGADTPAASFDSSAIVKSMVDSAQGQLLAALGIIAGAVATITVAVVLVRFGRNWIKQLGKG